MVITTQSYTPENWCAVGRTLVQDYYVSRPAQAVYDDYWGVVTDPDGNVRDRLSEAERLRYLGDIDEELSFLRNQPPGLICDVGCGPGWLLRELPDWWRVGVEIAPQARAELTKHRIAHCSDVLELQPGRYDVVVAYHVIEHLADPVHALCDWQRLLKKGGWLILGTPDFGSPCAERFGENYRLLRDPTHVSLFTLESMHRMLRDHGFAIRDVRFPFPERYATVENFARWNDTSKVSPAWPGNFVTFYATRS